MTTLDTRTYASASGNITKAAVNPVRLRSYKISVISSPCSPMARLTWRCKISPPIKQAAVWEILHHIQVHHFEEVRLVRLVRDRMVEEAGARERRQKRQTWSHRWHFTMSSCRCLILLPTMGDGTPEHTIDWPVPWRNPRTVLAFLLECSTA